MAASNVIRTDRFSGHGHRSNERHPMCNRTEGSAAVFATLRRIAQNEYATPPVMTDPEGQYFSRLLAGLDCTT